jgi:hypothetical protein
MRSRAAAGSDEVEGTPTAEEWLVEVGPGAHGRSSDTARGALIDSIRWTRTDSQWPGASMDSSSGRRSTSSGSSNA